MTDTDIKQWTAYYDWLATGMENRWCSARFCYTHETPPISDEEDRLLERGEDPCVTLIRLYGVNGEG